MRKIHFIFIALAVLLSSVACTTTTPTPVSVGVGVGAPHASIAFRLSNYPYLVPVPGYPVYYAPRLEANFFFYDGMYWIYENDNWYYSAWYNGPWWYVEPEVVPTVILQIPVGYYRQPPVYFNRWQADAPPRWEERWGRDWGQRRGDWDRRERDATLAPLPGYQEHYSGDRYPQRLEQQRELRERYYRYRPREPITRRYYDEVELGRAPSSPPPKPYRYEDRRDDRDYRRDGY